MLEPIPDRIGLRVQAEVPGEVDEGAAGFQQRWREPSALTVWERGEDEVGRGGDRGRVRCAELQAGDGELAEVRLHLGERPARRAVAAEERDLEMGVGREEPEQLPAGVAGRSQHRGSDRLRHDA